MRHIQTLIDFCISGARSTIIIKSPPVVFGYRCFIFALLVVYVGCASVGYKVKEIQPVSFSFALETNKLYVKTIDIKGLRADFGPFQMEYDAILDAVVPDRINQVLSESYPNVFAQRDGLPICLSIIFSCDRHDGKAVAGMILSSLTMGLMPVFITSDYLFKTRIENQNERSLFLQKGNSVTVQRIGWLSILPTGYLPCPSSSNTSKELITGMYEPQFLVSDTGKAFIAKQVAAGVAKLVSESNSEDLKRLSLLHEFLKE